MSLPRTLFVGKGATAVNWYRCALPAMKLEQEWVGVWGDPDALHVVTGETARPFTPEELFEYDVVVLQQPDGAWSDVVRKLKARGIVVLFEIDDYVHGVRAAAGHEGRRHWDRKRLAGLERNMALADGLICSTPFLARRYRRHNKRVWVCRNSIDPKRYTFDRAPAHGVTVGWAGGVGHGAAMAAWLPSVAQVMRERPEVRFASVGQPYADGLVPEFGPERAIAVPWGDLESYPASMSRFDLAIAPSGGNDLYRGKSDLRWLESAALGIPLIADPGVYPDIEHGVTGFHARSAEEARVLIAELAADPSLRHRVGAAARAHVLEHRSIDAGAQQWADVLLDAVPLRTAI